MYEALGRINKATTQNGRYLSINYFLKELCLKGVLDYTTTTFTYGEKKNIQTNLLWFLFEFRYASVRLPYKFIIKKNSYTNNSITEQACNMGIGTCFVFVFK